MTATWSDIKQRLSLLRKLSYWKLNWEEKGIDHHPDGFYTGEEQRVQIEKFTDATVLGSMDKDYPGFHRLVLDIDHPAVLIPSSTPGHSHLIVDAMIPQIDWEKLITALADAGVIEKGYAGASVRRGQSFIRAPWVGKEGRGIPADGLETRRTAIMEDGNVPESDTVPKSPPASWDDYRG